MNKLFKTQIGDTIVEVILAVAVVSLALGLGFGVANRSLKGFRQAQERSEATKVVESQLEGLKAIGESSDKQGVFTRNVFCVGLSGANQGKITEGFAPEYAYTENVADDTLDKYGECASTNGRYNAAIKRNGNAYTVTVRWFGTGETTKEEIKAEYRMYE